MDLSIVIPVFNEAASIALLVDEVCAQLDGALDFEILVVDDGSTDTTPGVLQTSRQAHPQLRIMRHRYRYGQSTAIASGVNAALAPWIATLDGDGQNDPVDILKLYRVMDRAPDTVMLVTGYRKQRKDHGLKRVSSRIANTVRAAVLGDKTPDSACGLKIFAPSTFTRLPQFDHMHRYLPALVQRLGGEVLSVEVQHRARLHGQSKYGIHNRLWSGILDMLCVRWLQRRAIRPVVSEIK